MPEIQDRLPGEVILASYSNEIRDRAVMRYADRTARDASNPIPATGDLAYILTLGLLEIFDGVKWESYLTDENATAIQTRLDVLENLTVDPFNGGVNTFSGTVQLELAAVTPPVDGDYMVRFDTLLRWDEDSTVGRSAFRLERRAPLTQVELWEVRTEAAFSNAEWGSQSFGFWYPLPGLLAGDEYYVSGQMTTTQSLGSVSNTFLQMQQIPAGVI